jgi:hypothetical protein
MNHNESGKINIDIYFSEFENLPQPSATPLVETSLAPVEGNIILREVPFDENPLKKELDDNELWQASEELLKLRQQLSDFSIAPSQFVSSKGNPKKRSLGIVTILMASILTYGGFRVFAKCQAEQNCQEFTQAVKQVPRQTVAVVSDLGQTARVYYRNYQAARPQASASETLSSADQAFSQGLDAAFQAATLSQSAITIDDWLAVVHHWEMAIAYMASAAQERALTETAMAKITLYQKNRDYAQSEIDPFREAVNAALKAANLTQTALTKKDWQVVSQYWIGAIDLMKTVPPDSPHYSLAQHKIMEYSSNLVYSQSKVIAIGEEASYSSLLQGESDRSNVVQ